MATVEVIEFEGVAYRRYPLSTHPGARNYFAGTNGTSLHRAMWVSRHGPIPAGYEVHHKDGNTLNNQMSNFECLTKLEHQKLHRVHPIPDEKTFAGKLAALRRAAGMSQPALAKASGVPVSTLRQHEQARRDPAWAHVVRLAHALGVTTAAFDHCELPSTGHANRKKRRKVS